MTELPLLLSTIEFNVTTFLDDMLRLRLPYFLAESSVRNGSWLGNQQACARM